MSIYLIALLFLIGLALIVKGGDVFVDSATWIAEVSGIPKFIVGATIVSFATTLPEIIVSVLAAVQGNNAMAIGNAVGSVTVNVGFIMALSIVCIPVAVKRSEFAFKGLLMVASVILLFVFSLNGEISVVEAFIIIALCVVYLAENVINMKKASGSTEKSKTKISSGEIIRNTAGFIFGAAGIVIGARLLVDNGTKIAEMLNIPQSIISATLVAIGTSLPELVTAVTAILKKQSTLSVGNIIGANIIDLTVILPICSIISGKGLPLSAQGLMLDIPACIFVCALAVIPTLLAKKLTRLQGIIMMVFYVAYVIVMCSGIIAF